MNKELQANSDSELLRVLADIDVSVPTRLEGCTTEHKEWYTIAHLLSALVGKDRLSYPLNLIKKERPDFLLTLNGMQVGIEHTEAVPQNEAHKDALRGEMNRLDAHYIQPQQPGEREKSKKELMAEIEADPLGDGWSGDDGKREWANAIVPSIDKKVIAIQKNGFEKFEQNWLLIYLNHPLPPLNLHEAVRFVQKRLIEQEARQKFERIYVMTDQYLCEFDHARMQRFDVNNLWKS